MIPLRESYARARPWLSLCYLWVLFEAPTMIRPGGVDVKHLRPSGDLLVLLTVAALSGRVPAKTAVRTVLVAYTALLVIVRLDYVVFMLLMRDEPLLYDQWLMLRHLSVLIADLWSPSVAFATLAISGALALLPWLVRRNLKIASELLSPARIATTARVGFLAWSLVCALTAVHAIGMTELPLVGWVSPVFTENIRRSRDAYLSIQRGIRNPAYAELLKIRLPEDKRPDVFLLLIESYGRMMYADPNLKNQHARRMAEMQARTESEGWASASGYSASSVSGGRSWMAEASILLGTPVTYEALYQHLMVHAGELPSLVSLTHKQGYQTLLLAGSDRERPGIKLANPYGYDAYISFDTLDYRGRPFGWGIVPDQFSLGFVNSRYLQARSGPIFLNAHLISSHAPWKVIPPWVEDWRTLGSAPSPGARQENDGPKTVLRSLRRFKRDDAQHDWYMGNLTEGLRRGYERAIDYELSVVEDFLLRQKRPALIIVMGDHQPPVIPNKQDPFDVPVHVFSQDKLLLGQFLSAGYVPGLSPQKSVSTHSGLLSLVARTLVSNANPTAQLPPFRPEGVHLVSE